MIQKYIKSFDGTRIGYQVAGTGKRAFVLCNGLGGSLIAWSPIYKRFGKDFKFITWDYRGVFTSDAPENKATLAIPYNVKDLEIILKKEGVTKGLVGGWSMGVQVALEFYRHRPRFFKGLFLINGTCGYPLRTAFNSPLTRYLVPVVNSVLKRVLPRVQSRLAPVAHKVISTEEFIKLIIRLGMIHRNFNTKIFRQIAADIINTDLGMYHEVLDHLCVHDATDVMPTIRVPSLLVAGTRDIMTPAHAMEKMANCIPGAEFLAISEGSHYSLLEFPDLINERLELFLKEHGFIKAKIRQQKKIVKRAMAKKKPQQERRVKI